MKTLPKGHKSLLDPTFKYVPAAETDIRHTIIRATAAHLGVVVEPKKVLTVVRKKS